MSMQANYFKLGLFVLIGIALIVGVVVFLSAEAMTQKPVYMETYFDQSVKGLEPGAPVSMRGVKIGSVDKIGFVTEEYGFKPGTEEFRKYGRLIRVVIAATKFREGVSEEDIRALRQQMIDDGLRVRMMSQPLTGVAYLEADHLDPKRYPLMEIGWEPKYMYIPSAPSTMSKLMSSAETAFEGIASIDFERLGKQMEQLLTSLNKAVEDARIGAVSQEATGLLSELRATNMQLQSLLRTTDSKEASATLEETMANLNQAIVRLDTMVKRSGPQLEQTMAKLKSTLADLQEVTGDLKKNPSKLFFGRPPSKSEIDK